MNSGSWGMHNSLMCNMECLPGNTTLFYWSLVTRCMPTTTSATVSIYKHVWKFEVHSFCTHTSHYLTRKQLILHTFMTRLALICNMTAHIPGNFSSMHSRARLTFTWGPNQCSIQWLLVAFLVGVKLSIHMCLELRLHPSYALMMLTLWHRGNFIYQCQSLLCSGVLSFKIYSL